MDHNVHHNNGVMSLLLDDYSKKKKKKNHNHDNFKLYWNPDYEARLLTGMKTYAFIEPLKQKNSTGW